MPQVSIACLHLHIVYSPCVLLSIICVKTVAPIG